MSSPENSPLFAKAKEFNALQLGTWGTEFHQDLHDEEADIVVVKPRISSFCNISLEAIFRANAIDTLLLTGVSTENAILSTTRDVHDRDYQVIIVEDACGALTDEGHRFVVELLSSIATITTSDIVSACLEACKVA